MTMNDAASVSVGERLGNAVYQNSAFSFEGILERIFAKAFKGLVYPQIWEDPVIDMQALNIGPDDHLICIASGSCNTMSYLTAGPAKITAVDLSPAHVALGRLKITAAQNLPDYRSYYKFFGEANRKDNLDLYEKYIAPNLEISARSWWEKGSLFSGANIKAFTKGFYRKGLLGRFIGTAHFLARRLGTDVKQLGNAKNQEEQVAFYENNIAPLFKTRIVRFLASRRAALFGLGIPPAQYEALAGPDGDMIAVLKERTRKLVCDFPLKDNYFAWQAFMRRYEGAETGSLPPYLQEDNFQIVRNNASRLQVLNESFTDHLQTLPDASRNGYVLLDAQDWMNDEQLNELWAEITRTAAPGARVIFRTAAQPTLLTGRVHDSILSKWDYRESESEAWTLQDRSAIYGGFHLYVKAG